MRKPAGLALFALTATLFLIANRGAYEGYFHGDELDNMFWTRYVPAGFYAYSFLIPRYFEQNFRPAGHGWFALMSRFAGYEFRWYVAFVHALHLLNIWLVWRLLRRFGLAPFVAGAGTLFFAFHMAVFGAYWKPMYVFDVLCATFTLAAALFYLKAMQAEGARPGAWLLSFVFFWLATKAKEMAVMLPAALLACEYWLGRRNWKRLAPFFAVSLALGVQALLVNRSRAGDYALEFAPAALWGSIAFYSSKLFLLPYAGLTVLALPFITRDRRAWFGLAWFGLFLLPMLLLTHRLYGAYLYLPLAGLALAFGAMASKTRPVFVGMFFAIWIPWNHAQLRADRREALSLADENRRYVTELHQILKANPEARAFVYDGLPASLHPWGLAGVVRGFYGRQEIDFYPAEERDLQEMLGEGRGVVLLSWDPAHRRLSAFARPPGVPDATYITLGRHAPVWQFGEGWYAFGGHFRWSRPYAVARLRRPANATAFELVVNMGPPPAGAPLKAEVALNGEVIGSCELVRGSGWQTVQWKLPPRQPGPVRVEFRIDPPFVIQDDGRRPLGLAVGAFGFLPK